MSVLSSGSGASSQCRIVSWKMKRDDEADADRGEADDQARAELVQVLDERDAIAVLEATRQPGHVGC